MVPSGKDLHTVEEAIKALIRYKRIKIEYDTSEEGVPEVYIVFTGTPIKLTVTEVSKKGK